MDLVILEYINEWNKRNPDDPFANLVKGEISKTGASNYIDLYIAINVGGILHKQKLMQKLSKGISFISVENALKEFFDTYPKFSDFDIANREVDPLAPTGHMVSTNDTPITFEEILRSADENGFHIPRNYILVDKKPDILPNTPPTTNTTTTPKKNGIGWILLGIAVGGIVLYIFAKK